tara:strand:+ start:733 stop:930 length:198 start_codon:yes stop_codon:yes gene_type:complete
MKLEEFRLKQKLSYKSLAKFLEIIGQSPETTVFRWCKNERMPRKKFMDLIKAKTNGKVSAADFYE